MVTVNTHFSPGDPGRFPGDLGLRHVLVFVLKSELERRGGKSEYQLVSGSSETGDQIYQRVLKTNTNSYQSAVVISLL